MLFVRAVLQRPQQNNVTLLDLDVFTLTGCSDEVGSSVVKVCIPQEMLHVNATIPPITAAGWESISIEVYARDEVNMNYYNSKLVAIWELSLVLDGVEWVGTAKLSPTQFRTRDSQTKFRPHGAPPNASVSNLGQVQAHDNANFSIAPACDGLLFPFAENAQMVYSDASFKALLGMVQAATQGQGQHLWALHYGWMWKGGFGYRPDMGQVDPAFLKRMVGWDRAAGVDAVVLWGMPHEAGRIADRGGIFAERKAAPSAVAAAKKEGGWDSVLQGWYPGYCSGYGGWHQTWTSRRPASNFTIGVARDCCGVHGGAGADDPWFFSVTIRVSDTILFNASSSAACREAAVPSPCPGMDAAGAAALGLNCTVRCVKARGAASVAFNEVVDVRVPPTMRQARLELEMAELKGVGNWDSGVQFAVKDAAESGASSEWVFSAGVRDPTIVPIYDAIVDAFGV